ncbi:MAG: hypothetical protein PHO89_01165 [Methylacidiphilaceae bacterium]|nr:hypothetical protein [Candidatus Methylacidiphilaceae bacterium]
MRYCGARSDAHFPEIAAIREELALLLRNRPPEENGSQAQPASGGGLEALLRIPRGDLRRAFVLAASSLLGCWGQKPERWEERQSKDTPETVFVAQHLGARLTWEDVDQDFLEGLSKSRLVALAEQLAPHEVEPQTKKAAIKRILRVAKANPEIDLPEELRFVEDGDAETEPEDAETEEPPLEEEAV